MVVYYATGKKGSGYTYGSYAASLSVTSDPQATVFFYVYETTAGGRSGSMATITFNGNTYSDGGSANVAAGCSEAYSIQANGGWPFFEWIDSQASDYFGNPLASATVFYAGTTVNVVIALVLETQTGTTPSGGGCCGGPPTVSASTGGYTQYSRTGFSGALADFTLPTQEIFTPTINGDSNNVLDIYVALGGVNGEAYFQAGVHTAVTSTGSIVLCPYYMTQTPSIFPSLPTVSYHYYSAACNGQNIFTDVRLGDPFYVQIGYSYGGTSWDIEQFRGGFVIAGASGFLSSFQPDLSTAEWGVGSGAGVMQATVWWNVMAFPKFGTITFTGVRSSDSASLLGPIVNWLQFGEGIANPNLNQDWALPDPNGMSTTVTPTSFVVQYMNSCGC